MYKCNICSKVFDSPFKLGGHKSSHSRGNLKDSKEGVECQFCSKVFVKNRSSSQKFCNQRCFKDSVQYEKQNRLVVVYSEKHQPHTLNITNAELESYREKSLVCDICGNKETIKGGKIKLAIDHNHTTHRFRGLLCYACNVKLAWLEKEWSGIKNYLSKDGFEF